MSRDESGSLKGVNVEERRLLTIQQVARYLQISRASVYRLIGRGELKAVKVGRCRRIAADDLQRFVEGLRGESEGGAASS